MKISAVTSAAAVLAVGLGGWVALRTLQADPLYDRVNVNLPYQVTIGDRTLPPGDYIFQQLPSTGGDSRVVLVYSDNGMKFKTSAMSIPTLDPNTARDTKLELDHVGNDYYLHKIWIQGKDYGYEFPLPDNVKSREKEMTQTATSIPAQYSTSPSTEAENSTATTENNTSTSAENTTPTETTPPATSNNDMAQSQTPQSQDMTQQQSTTPATPTPNYDQNQQTDNSSANRSAEMDNSANANNANDNSANNNNNDTNSMPHTSAGWLMMLLSGGALSGMGMKLRRSR